MLKARPPAPAGRHRQGPSSGARGQGGGRPPPPPTLSTTGAEQRQSPPRRMSHVKAAEGEYTCDVMRPKGTRPCRCASIQREG